LAFLARGKGAGMPNVFGFNVDIFLIYLYYMATVNEIRNRVIDSLMTINDPHYLKALEDMIKTSNVEHSSIPLTEEQKIMLAMSDEDIKEGRVIDQDALNKEELEWLAKK
jgi:hypothetical protein